MTASTSLLLIDRIASRSLTSARPISSSLVLTETTVRSRPSDAQLRPKFLGARFVLVTNFLTVPRGSTEDQRIPDHGDRREDEPLDRVTEVRSFVEHRFRDELGL